jgi:hypothetical protein
MASVESTCHVSRGFFRHHQGGLSHISFFTFADVFTLSNANTLKIILDEEKITFLKTDLRIGETSVIRFKELGNKNPRSALVLINKMPTLRGKSRKFSGQLIMANQSTRLYQFHCRF